jgi:hypothetical protein
MAPVKVREEEREIAGERDERERETGKVSNKVEEGGFHKIRVFC